jgi:HEAT repeat protein
MKIPPLPPSIAVALAAASLLATPGCKSSQGSGQSPATLPAREAAEPTAAVKEPDAELRGKIVSAMSGYEHIVTREELVRLGSPEQLTEALIAIYGDQSVHLVIRTNALASLRFFPSPRAKSEMEKVLMSADTDDTVRRSAIRAYGSGFRDAAVPMLARFLSHPEIHTRDITAKTLGDLQTPEAVDALRRRLPQESEPMVRKSIESRLPPAGK